MRPEDTAAIHERSVEWLRQAATIEGTRHVVVTHHSPSLCSVPERWKADRLTPAYASNLDALFREMQPCLWVHGHIHHRADYTIGNTRVVCNPRGYPDEPVADFEPGLIVEL